VINNKCEWDNCTEIGTCYIFGHSYCYGHNSKAVERQFYTELKLWDGQKEPWRKLINLLARFIEIIAKEKPFKGSYLTPGRIKHRAYSFVFNKGIIEFKIIRHLNAWKNENLMREVEDHWKFDTVNRKIYLFSRDDPDNDGIEYFD